jgi:fumarate reductase subunit D
VTRFLFADANMPFAVAVGVLLALVLVQIIGMLIGFGASDADLDADIDLDAEVESPLTRFLHVGELPTMVLVGLFCAGFGLSGYAVQAAAESLTGSFLHPLAASAAALLAALPGVSLLGKLLRKSMFREDSTAVSADSLVGRPAVITLGAASAGKPSQAKVTDVHGQTHYVLVEPLRSDSVFSNGESVLLVQRQGAKYLVVADSVEGLSALDLSDGAAVSRQVTESQRNAN